MAPEKDKVALIVEGDDLASGKLRLMGEERREHPADRVPEARVKVVDDELGDMPARLGMVLSKGKSVNGANPFTTSPMYSNILGRDDARQLKVGRRPIRKVNERDGIGLLLLLVHNEQVGILAILAKLDNLLNLKAAALVEFAIRNDREQVVAELERLLQAGRGRSAKRTRQRRRKCVRQRA